MAKSLSSSRRALAVGLILALLGMVVPATSAPAAEGATVTVRLASSFPANGLVLVLTSTTDTSVSFEAASTAGDVVQFLGVPPGSYNLSLKEGQPAWSRIASNSPIHVGSGNAEVWKFPLRKGMITGTLPADARDTVIRILEQSGEDWEEIANSETSDTVQIDSDGTFRVYLPYRAVFGVYFEPSESSDYLPSHYPSIQPAAEMGVGAGELLVGGEDTASYWGAVALVPAAIVEGNVTDVDGNPLSGVNVALTANGTLYDWGTEAASAIATSVTDAHGNYRLKTYTPEPTSLQVTAYGSGSYVDTTSDVFVLSPTALHQAGIDVAIAYESVPPTAEVVVANTVLGLGGSSLVRFTFSEPVIGFGNEDVLVPNGTLSPVSSEDGGLTWTAMFTPAAGVTDSSNVISLDTTGLTDGVGNAGVGTVSSNNFAIDTERPTATVVVEDPAVGVGETSVVRFAFSEAVTGFTLDDLEVANGTLGPVSSADGGLTWTATFTPTDRVIAATNAITLDMQGVTDHFGNSGVGAVTSNNYAIDTVPPAAVPTVLHVDTDNSLVTLTGTGVAGAAVAVGGDTEGSAVVDADGRWSLTLDLEVGLYQVSVTQTVEGKESNPAYGTITVRPTVPEVLSIQPNATFPHAQAPSQLSGLGVDGAIISVALNDETYTAIAASTGWTVDFGAPLAAGAYSFSVTQMVNGVASNQAVVDFVVEEAVPDLDDLPSPGDSEEPGDAVNPVDPADPSDPVGGDVASGSDDTLATTGATSMVPLGIGALVMLLLGGVALAFTSRRQKAAIQPRPARVRPERAPKFQVPAGRT